MGSHTWISDHLLGLCRLDSASDRPLTLNTSTCFLSDPSAGLTALAPGQPAFDPAWNVVYVPDLGSKSAGVWRLKFDPATETVSQPMLMPGLAGVRPSTVALGPDGKLYVGSRSASIPRFANPASASPTIESVGLTSDTKGVTGIAFVGEDLYLAESAAVTKLVNARNCAGGCIGQVTSMQVGVPTAMLFVPSVEGRSHSAAEYTTIEDAARGASVLATALSLLAY